MASASEIRATSLRIFDRSFAVTYWLQAVAIAIGLFGVAANFSAQVLARRKEGLQVFYRIADPSIYKLCELVCGSLEQQHTPERQLVSLPAALMGAVDQGVRVRCVGAMADGGRLVNASGLRGLAEITADVEVDMLLPTDAY
jgi:hypothetical protein